MRDSKTCNAFVTTIHRREVSGGHVVRSLSENEFVCGRWGCMVATAQRVVAVAAPSSAYEWRPSSRRLFGVPR